MIASYHYFEKGNNYLEKAHIYYTKKTSGLSRHQYVQQV